MMSPPNRSDAIHSSGSGAGAPSVPWKLASAAVENGTVAATAVGAVEGTTTAAGCRSGLNSETSIDGSAVRSADVPLSMDAASSAELAFVPTPTAATTPGAANASSVQPPDGPIRWGAASTVAAPATV